jgi:hypothetical protein
MIQEKSMAIVIKQNRIDSVMVGMLATSAVGRGFDPQSDQTKNYEIGICCFSAKYTALRSTSKDRLESG